MWQVLVGPLAGLAKQWLDNRKEKSAAKHQRQIKDMTREQSWEELAMKNSAASWTDEWLVLLFSIPLILCFFPSMVEHVQNGFKALDTMPEWYKYTISIIVASTFGVRKAIDWKRTTLSRGIIQKKVIEDDKQDA